MNRLINYSTRIALLLNLTLVAALAPATPGSAQTDTTGLISSLAARTFCEQRGGTVTETGDQHVYVCCYKQQRKCLVSNTRLSQSVLVDLPWNAKRF